MIIWLASYPKSGNTWLRMFLRSYFLSEQDTFSINVKGNLDFESETFPNLKLFKSFNVDHSNFENIVKNWINLQDFINLNGKINFLKTHNGNYSINSHPFTNKENTIGGIYMVRDPRDVLLSFSHHLKLKVEEVLEKMSTMNHFELDENDPDLIEGYRRSLIGSWSKHYLSWKSYQARKILFLKYEDLVENPYENFLLVLKYLKNFKNFEINEGKIKKSIIETSFDNLKNDEVNNGFLEQGMNKGFFRKGKVSDWKENLNSNVAKKVEVLFQKEMIELGYL